MKFHDEMIIYERDTVSDGAGGREPGTLTEITRIWGAVKPLAGMLAMSFQELTGSQGFEIMLRTDFDFVTSQKYIIGYQGIYGEQLFSIHSLQIEKHYTKLVCKSENKYPVQTT